MVICNAGFLLNERFVKIINSVFQISLYAYPSVLSNLNTKMNELEKILNIENE